VITARDNRGGRVLAAGVLVAALICACDHSVRGQSDLAALKQALPGSYTSPKAGGAATGASSNEVSLSIAPATAQAVGDTVFFVRETATGNEHLVLAERIWTLEVDDKGNLLQHFFLLRDPRRWIAAADHVEVLTSMLPEDLEPLPGCDLSWRRSEAGFESTPQKGATCQAGGAARGLWIEQQIKLEGGDLTLGERQFGDDGVLLPPAGSEYTLVLRRGASRTGAAQTVAPAPGPS
jgi:hypothetical protein